MSVEILGVNRRSYPTKAAYEALDRGAPLDECDNLYVSVVVVLVGGEVGDYAAYIGGGDPEFVARHGDKLCFEEAKVHFPWIVKERYRD